ncbi:MAG: ribonuclease P protein component [Candidatus Paceibacterota bacterium]|jgi:ribonuclease P protein component
MLARQYRLAKEKDIRTVYKNKAALFGRSVIVNFGRNNLTNSRFAFVVSAKTLSKAVDRNYYKRILRDIIYKLLDVIPTNLDIVIVIKKGITQMNFQEIDQELSTIVKKLNK